MQAGVIRRMASKTKIKAVLIDFSGTLHVEDDPTPNAIQALEKLRNVPDVRVRFVTNTSKESKNTLFTRLNRMGFTTIAKEDMFTSMTAAVQYIQSHQLRPYYLVSKDAESDFASVKSDTSDGDENAVVVGLAPDEFVYEKLNYAFRVLMRENSQLVAVHEGKYYKRGDGLALGPGCFTRGLEYASGKKAVVIGKPNAYFFRGAVPEGLSPEDCCMIGDDINDDVTGAMNVGMKGILVKTGKYLPNIEATAAQPPTQVLDSFAHAVDWLLQENFTI